MESSSAFYAWKLLVEAIEANEVASIRSEVEKMMIVLQEQPRFLELLKAPMMEVKKKKEWIEETFFDQLSRIVIDFWLLLVEEDAMDQLEAIAKHYDATLHQHMKEQLDVVEGKVYSATGLTVIQLEKLEQLFTEKTNMQVRLTPIVDVSLIGGYKVEVNGHVYDDTVGLQLKQLRASLKSVDLK